jgi:hypothetical protein
MAKPNMKLDVTKDSTDNYVLVATVEAPHIYSNVNFQFCEENVNAVLYRIDASQVNETATFKTLKNDGALAKGGVEYEPLYNEGWVFFRIYLKSAVAGQPGRMRSLVTFY